MLTGCVQRVFFPQVNAATARVLAAEGCDVIIPAGQGCCGALSLHGGRRAEAVRFARRTIEEFERAAVDAIVVNVAGCGSAMKEYAELLADDPGWSERAAVLAGKVRDLSEYLAGLGPAAPRHPLDISVAYHDACHLAHAQRITAQPRELLAAIPGLRLAAIPDGGTCCGSAGIYNLVQPEPARELGQRKATAVAGTGADLLVTGNPGCAMQITSALAARGTPMPTAHIAEVLDASLRGLRPGTLLGLISGHGPLRRPLSNRPRRSGAGAGPATPPPQPPGNDRPRHGSGAIGPATACTRVTPSSATSPGHPDVRGPPLASGCDIMTTPFAVASDVMRI